MNKDNFNVLIGRIDTVQNFDMDSRLQCIGAIARPDLTYNEWGSDDSLMVRNLAEFLGINERFARVIAFPSGRWPDLYLSPSAKAIEISRRSRDSLANGFHISRSTAMSLLESIRDGEVVYVEGDHQEHDSLKFAE